MKLPQLPDLKLSARRMQPYARWAALAGVVWSTLACLYVMFGRLLYPFELEWMSGSIVEHIERVQRHLPLYTRPTSSWIPFLYPPGYYVLVASLAGGAPPVLIGRLLSIAATFAQAACIWRLARKHGASRFWGAVALGAFFVAFQQTDFWYDLERPDSVFVAATLLSAVLLDDVPGVVGAALAGLLLGGAFFVKQPAVLFIFGATVGLALRREWARVVAFGAVSFGVIVPIATRLEASSGGWFSYYVLKMPRAHGTSWSLAPLFFLTDLPHGWIGVVATAIVVGGYAWRKGRGRDDAIFASFLAASFVASATSRLHIGGWANVLMFWTSFAAAAVGIASQRLETLFTTRLSSRAWSPMALLVLPMGFLLHVYNCFYYPADLIPMRRMASQLRGLIGDVRAVEKDGEVIAVGRGHLTSQTHFHMAAFIDVITTDKKIPEEILNDFRAQRFAGILIDNFADLRIPLHPELKDELFHVVLANYYVARRLDERLPPPIIGWRAVPSWLLLPRKAKLDEFDHVLHERRTLEEARIAENRERAERMGTRFPTEPESAEIIGSDIVRREFGGAIDPDPDAGPPKE